MIGLLGRLGRNATPLLAAGVFVGLALPPLAALIGGSFVIALAARRLLPER